MAHTGKTFLITPDTPRFAFMAKLANTPRFQNTEIMVICTSITDSAHYMGGRFTRCLLHICKKALAARRNTPPADNLLAAKHAERATSQRNKYLIHFSFPAYGAHFMSR